MIGHRRVFLKPAAKSARWSRKRRPDHSCRLPLLFSALTINGVTGSMTSGLVALGGDNVYSWIALGFWPVYHGDGGAGDVAYIFLAVHACACDHRNRRTNTVRGATSIVYYAMLSVSHASRLALRRFFGDHCGGQADADVL